MLPLKDDVYELIGHHNIRTKVRENLFVLLMFQIGKQIHDSFFKTDPFVPPCLSVKKKGVAAILGSDFARLGKIGSFVMG